jgi:hypothetical protein
MRVRRSPSSCSDPRSRDLVGAARFPQDDRKWLVGAKFIDIICPAPTASNYPWRSAGPKGISPELAFFTSSAHRAGGGLLFSASFRARESIPPFVGIPFSPKSRMRREQPSRSP